MSYDINTPRWNSPDDLPDADTTVLIRTNDDDSLARFWTQSQYAEAMAEACARFNSRAKKRPAHGQATVMPDELFAAAHKRVLEVITGWMDLGTAADALDEMSTEERRLTGDITAR